MVDAAPLDGGADRDQRGVGSSALAGRLVVMGSSGASSPVRCPYLPPYLERVAAAPDLPCRHKHVRSHLVMVCHGRSPTHAQLPASERLVLLTLADGVVARDRLRRSFPVEWQGPRRGFRASPPERPRH